MQNDRNAAEAKAAARTNLWKAVGPGILMACAAVGGSHLVWSTRAGAEFGWSLLGLVLLANLLKFPFFLYGQRYTSATGESLLDGYCRQGMGYVYVFLGINILTGIINTAGVAMLSGALFAAYGIFALPVHQSAVLLMAVCALIILLGHYALLDGISKIIIVVLTLCTVVAVGFALVNHTAAPPAFVAPSPWTWATLPFLVMLLGWMPAPVDLSAWSSLWMFSREKQTGHFASVRESSIDFYIGYVSCMVLAVLFVALGALVMYGSGATFSGGGIAFSKQFVSLYSATIGEWSRPLILTAAFITMFSTTLTVVDGYPRSLASCCMLIGGLKQPRFRLIHQMWIVLSVIVAAIVIMFFVSNLIQLLSFAAIVSFLTSPILAYINLKVMNGANVPPEQRPGPVLTAISWSGLAFFVAMSIGYVYVTFFHGA